MDKISKHYDQNSKEWETFGEIQVHIKQNFRKIKRKGLIPTFQEFAEYVAKNTTVLTPKINNHWKPIFYNCAPCIERYDAANIFGSDRSPRNAIVCPSIRAAQSALEQSIFIFLGQRALRKQPKSS